MITFALFIIEKKCYRTTVQYSISSSRQNNIKDSECEVTELVLSELVLGSPVRLSVLAFVELTVKVLGGVFVLAEGTLIGVVL